MRKELTSKTASLMGTSDLTIVAPIRKGFVPSLDAVTYKTRVERVLKTLHLGRVTAHEHELARVLSDAVERVGRIHSVRIAILEPEDQVMLAVTFDGSWESYIRVIWQKVARSLDLIFCNTEGYVTGWDHSFEEWCDWLRSAQAQTSFLYSSPGLTAQDTQYLRMYERRLRREPDPARADIAALRIGIPTAEEVSDRMCRDASDLTNLGLSVPLPPVPASRPAFRQGMRNLAGLHRLVDLHLPGTTDGAVLHRAATELLREFVLMLDNPSKYQEAMERAERRFKNALDWMRDTVQTQRTIPALPSVPPTGEFGQVQGGIVDPYPGTSQGCLVLLAFDSPADLGAFLDRTRPTLAEDVPGVNAIAVNLAVTPEGLRLAGLTDEEMAALPEEFVQGMEQRAGVLGDVRLNHPRRWRRPALNWKLGPGATDVAEEDPGPRVDLCAVHLVLQLRMCNATLAKEPSRQDLFLRAQELVEGQSGAKALSIQWMHRLSNEAGENREHFGFLDSVSHPVLSKAAAGTKYSNQVHLGEILLGYDNAADRAPTTAPRDSTRSLLRNGSFLVVRKLRQDVGALNRALDGLVQADAEPVLKEQQRQLLLAKMMGRWPDGSPRAGEALAASFGKNSNDFNFNSDGAGSLCPFHAHIRRANPRDTSVAEPPGARPARLVRRGMSYGPPHDPKVEGVAAAQSLAQERGLVFMAYNANIGEQFEVVQRWLTGGNSSGSSSGQSDPFLGVAEAGRQRFFRFEHDDQSIRMALDGSDNLHEDGQPIVRLEWGMYLFTPSIPALKTLAARAKGNSSVLPKSWSVKQGEAAISRLRQLEATEGARAAFAQWKQAIEDPATATDFSAASIWAAIRKNHAGVLQTPFGVLVASRELVDEVLHDSERKLTATGYLQRMHRSFGPLYLGMDPGQIDGTYERESVDVNKAIVDLVASRTDFELAVGEAATVTRQAIADLAADAASYARADCESHWEVSFEAREIIDLVLAHFCEKWFGLSERGGHLQKGGMRWNWSPDEPPCYPGHFMAPSRYTFQPHPGPEVERIGAQHGLALRKAVTNYLGEFGAGLTAPVAVAALKTGTATGDPSYAARTLAGVLMGFLPTTDGNMRRVLNEWLNEGTLWSLRAQHLLVDSSDPAARDTFQSRMKASFIAAMQLRAAPELLWRTAATGFSIGKPGKLQVQVRAGEIVIASLISATQECLEAGEPELKYAFGGSREKDKPHPTHACPGYGPATAVMLGFFQGLVESTENLRPGPAALTISMDGYVALDASCDESGMVPMDFHVEASTIPICVIGDSWLTDYGDLFLYPPSLASRLRRLGYAWEANDRSSTFRDVGLKLAQMAASANLTAIGQYLADLQGMAAQPRAVLIGGGGNDLVDPSAKPKLTVLYGLLNANASTLASALNRPNVDAFFDDTLLPLYVAILDVVTAATPAAVPILIHGYDHPVPDGRRYEGIGGIRGPWLESVFAERNVAPGIREAVMKVLIDRLNATIASLESRYPGRVHHMSLAGELAKQPNYAQDHTTYWANELHAAGKGYEALAIEVKKKLVTLGVK